MRNFLISFLLLLLPYHGYFQTGSEDWKTHFSKGAELFNANNYQEAIIEYEKSYSLAKPVLQGPDINLEEILFFLGKANLLKKDYEEAIKWLNLNLKLNEEILNANLDNKTILLNDIGFCYAGLDQHLKAIEYYKISLGLAGDDFDPNHKFLLLENLAGSLNETGNFKEAKSTYDEIGRLLQTYPDRFTQFQVIKNQFDISEAVRNSGDTETALQLFLALVEKYDEDLDHQGKISLFNTISNIYLDRKDVKSAMEYRYEALQMAKRGFSAVVFWKNLEENLAIAVGAKHFPSMTKLVEEGERFLLSNPEARKLPTHSFYQIGARLFLLMNGYEEALQRMDTAIEIAEKRYGDSPEVVEAVKAQLGDIYRKMGVYSQSNQAYLDYIKFFENNTSEVYHRELYPDYLIKQAENFTDLGQLEDSREFLHRALKYCNLEFKESNPLKFHLYRGAIFYRLGEYQKAEEYFDSASTLDGNLDDHYEARIGLIKSMFKSGEEEKAEKLFTALYGELRDNNYPLRRFSYKKQMGDLYFESQQFRKALDLYHDVYDAFKDPLADHDLIKRMIVVNSELGKQQAALELMAEYFALQEKNIERSYYLLGPRGQDGFFDQVRVDLEYFEAIVFEKGWNEPGFNSLLFENKLKYNGILGRANVEMRNELLTTAEPALVEEINKNLIYKQVSSNSNIKSFTNQRGSLADEKENESLKVLFKIYSQRYPDRKLLETHWQENLDFLKDNDLVLQFSSFKLRNRNERQYCVYAIKKSWESPKLLYLFKESELKAELPADKYNNYASRGSSSRSLKQQKDVNVLLYSRIFEPLEDIVTERDRIYFSLDGLLNTVAFSAFKKSEKDLPLVQNYDLVQVNDIRNLYRIKSPSKESISLIGGCYYGYDSEGKDDYDMGLYIARTMVQNGIIPKTNYRGSSYFDRLDSPEESQLQEEVIDLEKYLNTTTWNYLDGAMAEVQGLERAFNEAGLSTQVYSGVSATEETFKSFHDDSPKVLHIATHGFFDPNNAYFQIANYLREENYYSFENSKSSLNNSGLILSYGDYAWNKGLNPYRREDGILTAREISHLNLTNTDLVVLSACETALGEVESGEGVYGLQWAFRLAGVENLIMSLWEVPDKETEEFMSAFYFKWKDGTTAREAFQETQREMSSKYAGNPEKWAAFIMVQ